MKATGIVRRIDDLGRIVIPKEIRRTMRIRDGDPLEIYTDDGKIVMEKYNQSNGSREAALRFLAQAKPIGTFSFTGKTTIYTSHTGIAPCIGKADCCPKDQYDPVIGMAIAYCRAIGKDDDFWEAY